MNEILIELIRVSPAAAVAVIALYISHRQIQTWLQQTKIWAERQEEISMILGQVLESLRRLNGGK